MKRISVVIHATANLRNRGQTRNACALGRLSIFCARLRLKLVELLSDERQILHVEKCDIQHVTDNQHGAARLYHFQHMHVYRSATYRFNNGEQNMPAVEHGYRQHVQNREVHVQNYAEPEGELPAAFALEKQIVNATDTDWAAQVLQFHIRFRRCDRANCLQCAGHAVVNLFDRIGMRDRHYPSGVPLNTDSRLHFALSGQKPRLYRNVKPRSISLHMENELILRMFADVFQQRDWIVYWRLVEAANNIA